ncbi:VOC family protein [Catenuloplanes nepalensis]|nr:VOC family protein [Catenuloplanes nepalensis]
MFRELYPILSTTRMPDMIHFYRDLLGARQTYRFPDEGTPAYVGLTLGTGSEFGLAATDVAPPARRHIDLCVYADDCDAAVAHLRAHGITITEEPADQPWGERLARATDPDGNPLVILSRL